MSISVFLFAISREALAVNRYDDEQMESNDSWQNNKYAEQNLSIYHWLRLLSTINFGKKLITLFLRELQARIYIFLSFNAWIDLVTIPLFFSQIGPLKNYYFQILEYLHEYMNMDKIIFLPKRT